MPIISVHASCESTLGFQPSYMIINTSDDYSLVQTLGYLNGQVVNPSGFFIYPQDFTNGQPAIVKTSDKGVVLMIVSIDGSSNVNLVPFLPVGLASVAYSGSYGDLSNKPTRSQSISSRTLNSAFQLSNTRDAFVNYSVDIACTLTLTSGQTGTVFLEIASDSAFTTNLQEVGRTINGNTGSLTLGLNITQNATCTVGGYVPAGYYVRLRTANTSGTPTFAYRGGQEVLL